MLVEGLALDIIGQGEGSESGQRLVLEYDPRSLVRAAGSMMKDSLASFHSGFELVRGL